MRSRLLAPSSAWESRPGGSHGPKRRSRSRRLCWRRRWTRAPRAESRGEVRFHWHSNTTLPLDTHAKMSSVKDAPDALAALKAQYHRLRQSLARIGYISQGSVLQRSVAASGRSGYQWTRKVAQKTVSVSL